jgi:hypothetical protein
MSSSDMLGLARGDENDSANDTVSRHRRLEPSATWVVCETDLVDSLLI